MKNIVSLLITFSSLISCAKKSDNAIMNGTPSADTSKTYLALGDSYTIGQSVDTSGRYPVQTVSLLKQQGVKIKDADIIAVTGWTTGNLINALDNNPPKNNYSVVTLLIGVNNQYQHRSLDEYKTEFIELLNRSITYAGNNKDHVIVLSIPDYSVTPFAAGADTAEIAKEIDEFNVANKTIALAAGVQYLDITPISKEAKYNIQLVAGDGLHPSAIQYEKWSALLAPLMQQQLQ
ncbi:MAG TPA: SGNH/GDSL hydrolase family protein [Ginsengibacter sp.]